MLLVNFCVVGNKDCGHTRLLNAETRREITIVWLIETR
jgi:hypothetical protein